MPITPVTHALANASPATNPEILLGPSSVSITSSVFVVGTEPCYIQAFGLGSGENVRVEMVSGDHAANWRPLGKTVMVTPNNPMLRIDWPGRYRLTFSGVSLASILVQMYQGTTSHETIYGVSTINGGGTDFTAIIGTDPIQVVGSGTPTDPYDVSIIDLNYNDGGINLGPNAGDSTTGGLNICIGTSAGADSGGNQNVFVGQAAGENLAVGANKNVIIGFSAGNTANGDDNVIIGDGAGLNAAGDNLVLIGTNAGSGIANDGFVCIGDNAGASNTGSENIAIGRQSATSSSGSQNIAIGPQAAANVSSDKCICIGAGAGLSATFPDNSIAIGVGAATSASGSGIYIGTGAGDTNVLQDVIVIDQEGNAIAPTAAHYCMLGSATITHTVTAGTVISAGAVAPSDLRLKINIEDLDGACTRVNSLRPVWFEWNEEKLNSAGIPHVKTDLNKRHAGLIAQEVEEIIPEAVEYVAGKDGDSYKFIHYDRLVPYLIQYIQHLEERLSLLEIK